MRAILWLLAAGVVAYSTMGMLALWSLFDRDSTFIVGAASPAERGDTVRDAIPLQVAARPATTESGAGESGALEASRLPLALRGTVAWTYTAEGFAALEDLETGRSTVVRVDDRIRDATVVGIEPRRILLSENGVTRQIARSAAKARPVADPSLYPPPDRPPVDTAGAPARSHPVVPRPAPTPLLNYDASLPAGG